MGATSPCRRVIRAFKEEVSNTRAALVNHCVNWRDIFVDANSLDNVDDVQLYNLLRKVGFLSDFTKPWIANSKDRTYNFKIIDNYHNSIMIPKLAVSDLTVDLMTALSNSHIKVNEVRAAHIKKPVFVISFFDLTYYLRYGTRTIDFLNNIIYEFTGISRLSNFGNREKDIVIYSKSRSVRNIGPIFPSETLLINSQKEQCFVNIDKVRIIVQQPLDNLYVPKVLIALRNNRTANDIVVGMKDITNILIRSIPG